MLLGYMMGIQQAYAQSCGDLVTGADCSNGGNGGGTAIPEIDGAGAIIAIGLIAGVVALVRERFFRK